MSDITIPPEVVEAAARLLCRERHPCWSIVAEIFETDHDGQATEFRTVARSAIRAALAAWPRMVNGKCLDEVGRFSPAIILPMQETQDEA
jgi:hypothetical protein